jgi:predicted nuclease of predicted toxin-antitoxin system
VTEEKVTLLFDECVDRLLAAPAFSPHARISFVRDLLPGAVDEAILNFAQSEDMILVTEDSGFGRLLFQLRLPPPKGVILIALDPLTRAERQARLMTVAFDALNYASGAFVTVGPKRIRTRTF